VQIDLRRLSEVPPGTFVDLMNDPRVRRQMPLTDDGFDEQGSREWIEAKERLWTEHGFGPWAIFIDGAFAGWGGLQPHSDEAEIALVLAPSYWGAGKAVFDRIMAYGCGELGLDHVLVLFPPTRTRVRALLRLGFRRDGVDEVEGETFVRFRLDDPTTHQWF